MNNTEDEKYIQALEKEITRNSDTIKITYDDTALTATFDLQDNIKNKINDSITADNLDEKSIVKAPSSGKYYVKAISQAGSQSYFGVDDIVKVNKLKEVVSEAKNNSLTVDSNNKLYVRQSFYKLVLTEAHAKFTQDNNSWTFSYAFKNNKTYIVFIDSAELQQYTRPLQIIVNTSDWKIPLWEGNAPIANTSGEFKGIVRYNFDLTSRTITLSGGFLDKNNSIYIYESTNG